MNRFILTTLTTSVIPLLWITASFLFQRFVYNPIGNPEAKQQIATIKNQGITFIGPSVFHQRIDEKKLENELGIQVQLVTSIGQSTIANLVLSDLVAQKTPETEIFLAGHDRTIHGKGLHQCWPCSNLPLELIVSEWDEVRECFWYDAILGLFAELVPAKAPLTYATTDKQMINDDGWMESHQRYLSKQEEIIERMKMNLQKSTPIPREHLYKSLSKNCDFVLIAPPNGWFYSCPEDSTIACLQSLDSSWIKPDLWLDEGHINAKGARKFSEWLVRSIQHKQW